MISKEIILGLKKIDGEPVITGLITTNRAAVMLGCARNTVKKHARDGRIRYAWICHGEVDAQMLYYRVDVIKIAKTKEIQLQKKLKQMKGKK